MEYWSREEKVDAIQWTGGNFEEVLDWVEKCDLDLYIRGRESYNGVEYIFIGKVGDRDTEWGLALSEYAVIDSLGELTLLTERDFTKRYYRRPL